MNSKDKLIIMLLGLAYFFLILLFAEQMIYPEIKRDTQTSKEIIIYILGITSGYILNKEK